MTNQRKTTPTPDKAAEAAADDHHHREDLLDEALAESFPASDPISSLSTGDGRGE